MLEDLIIGSRKAKFLDRAGLRSKTSAISLSLLIAANYSITIDILKRLIAESLDIFGQKRAKIASLEKLRFRSPQQEEAVRLAAAKQSPLVTMLPTGGGKSLVFIVPAMLAGIGVTIVVALFAELKRQLVIRCVNAGLDCKS
ncbi:uncharacterized protein NECHADRAFT_88953 [Fusarium vanettenii 77-13-4]|uniref:DEAD/DEAH box helicase domain-containing protein n=1 Tax=Fusarium vanettenii (strain ATCC MYA-4622 / CBS 123669 / FGSC 9596 / NRRL 45880 / 77-13-4) TaxID=660122 RepID=C7ZJJ9_FUSV7|nr:uncharacterized protein NECHADRAFT_88953 [Fusarium vanettenii 77-13-4]EEU35802.1 hypothetical protein NECHADRAFT_88953 [Fusarium vanettenii 77-13-4]